jgi:hypothetical protein
MPQITLDIDDETLTKIEKAAESESMSVSKWVSLHVICSLENKYPKGYFELFGSIKDDTMSGEYKGEERRAE